MTVTATYKPDLSRVRVEFTSPPATADYAIIERSTDGINWSTVRGGDTVAISPGYLDDYEFVAGVANTYRVSYVDAGPIVGVTTPGVAATGNNASLTPAPPVTGVNGLAEGDTMVLLASIRATSATVNTPAGWTKILDLGNVCMFTKRAGASESAPTVSFTGGVANADTIAQIYAYHNAYEIPVIVNTLSNASAQNVSLASLNVTQTNMLNLWAAWKQDDWTTAVDARAFAVIGSTTTTTGDDASQWWSYTVQGNTDIDFTAGTLTVTGGAAAVSKSAAMTFVQAPWIVQQTTSITPVLDQAWLKNPRRPSLNTRVTVTNISDITRDARSGTFDVIGRTVPIVVSDVMGSRKFSISLMTAGIEEGNELDGRLAAGDSMFLQAPELDAAVPTAYVTVTGLTVRKSSMRGVRRFIDLDLVEVAAPASTVYGDTYVYADIPNDFATYNDVLANVSTYFQLMDRVSTSSIIVP